MNISWINSGISKQGFNWKGGLGINPTTNGLETATIDQENFKQVWWLEAALIASKKVARIDLGNDFATGFMITEDILITNQHVFEYKDDAKNSKVQFNYHLKDWQTPSNPDNWECDVDKLFKSNEALDYAIVKLKDKGGKKAGRVWGYFDISRDIDLSVNDRANIIQHPDGRRKEIAFRENQVRHISDQFIQYLTDTDKGSSGSPVMDDWFNVVALHNQRVRDPQSSGRWYRNQGYRIDVIYNEIKGFL